MIGVTLTYNGLDADNHVIDFYDLARAAGGFQRSLALTTHLVLNGEIITQAPALKGADILVGAFEAGSYKIPAYIAALGMAAGTIGTAPKDSVLGHLIYSVYDYAVSEQLGFHVDFDESLGQSYERARAASVVSGPVLSQNKVEALMEKMEPNIIDIHRPIVWSETAARAGIDFDLGKSQRPITGGFDKQSYNFINTERQDDREFQTVGKISSYNVNTYKGRVFCEMEERPIPFELDERIRGRKFVRLITGSLSRNALDSSEDASRLSIRVYRNFSSSGRLKSYLIIDVQPFGHLGAK